MNNQQQLDKGATIKGQTSIFPTFKYWNNYKKDTYVGVQQFR